MADDSPSSSSSERRRAVLRPEPRRKSADEAVPTVTQAERWVIALRRLRAQEESRRERAAQSRATTPTSVTTPSEVSTEEPEQVELAALRPKLRALERPPDKPMGFVERLRELWRQIRPSGKGGSSGSAGSSGGTAAPAG
jgi:hypothetical protein